MANANLLVELFVEELPPKALRSLGREFADGILNGLVRCQLKLREPGWVPFSSPRRLAVLIPDVAECAADRTEMVKLMPVSVGLDAKGNATPALLKKLASFGADASAVPMLERQGEGKAETLYFHSVIDGITLVAGLQMALNETLAKLPIPKVMTYQLADGWTSVQFVRPVHGLVALHGTNVVPVSVLGIAAGRDTHGHRFESANDPIVLRDADSYVDQLRTEGAVIASFDKRREDIANQLKKSSELIGPNLRHIGDDALLDEVTGLVERPNVLVGEFDRAFLEVPQECLILTMKANQKYFPLVDASGKLANKFLIVSNISPADTSAVVTGNERVVRPRLADAKFFYDQDRKRTLESRLPELDRVVYHNKLGTQLERTERVRVIARAIAGQLGEDSLAEMADQAARLAKADLLTDMVGEFPELQGVMGGYYARYDGLSIDVANAIEDHYKPRFAGDELPRNSIGQTVALADKLETLVGLFGIGQAPTGEKDPFALRRHGLGVVRILIEKDLSLDLFELCEIAASTFRTKIDYPALVLESFFRDRIRHYFQIASFDEQAIAAGTRYYNADAQRLGYSPQQIEAVLALSPKYLNVVPKLLNAVRAFSQLPEAISLAAANKRVANILKKCEVKIEERVETSLLKEGAEIELSYALSLVKPAADAEFEQGNFGASLKALAALREPVDAFFEQVMVNAEDPSLRANRLGLLATLHAAMNRVADLSRLAA